MRELLGLPLDASIQGYQIDNLIVWLHWLMIGLFIGWGGFFIYSLIRFRRSKNSQADYAGTKSRFSSYIEAIVAIIELLLLIGFSVPIWANVVHNFPSEEQAVVVRVVAEQFAWNIHYPGADGIFGPTDINLVSADNPLGLDRNAPYAKDDIVTINQLHLPVNKQVLIYLSTKDVMHSFFLPEMRVKQDAIPGMAIPLTFTPKVTSAEYLEQLKGTKREGKGYEIACAQLCGLGHYRMRGFMTIETAEEFNAWLAAEAAFLFEEEAEE